MEQQTSEDNELDMLTVQDVCEKLQVSRWMVNQLRRSGELPSVKVGARRRFRRRVVEAYERRLEEKEGG